MDHVFLYLKCVDCCIISSYHLTKAQISEAACTSRIYCISSALTVSDFLL